MKKKSFLSTFMIALVLISVFFSSCQKKEEASGPAELVTWGIVDTEPVYRAILDGFNAANPNIHVSLNVFSTGTEARDLIKPAINSGEGPDIFNYDTGAGYLGVLVSSGLALDLTPYMEKYNWKSRFLEWSLGITTYDGKLYGIANQVEMLGVFYNKKMFADNNITLPNSYDEFLAICQKFQDAGIVPVILDDREQWPGFHYESIWMNTFAGPQKVKDALANKIKWTDPDLILAMDKFSEFAQSGYVNKQINGLNYNDANDMFTAGGSAMRMTGTWVISQFVEPMGDNAGFFFLPPANTSIPEAPPGGFGSAEIINANTKYPDEAAVFLDYFLNPASCRIWYEGGYIPAVDGVDFSGFNLSGLFKDVLNEVNAAEEMGQNIDVIAGPRVNDAAMNYVQQLIDGVIDGKAAMDLKQKAQEDDIAAGDV